MKNPPSFQFYPQDFLADLNVRDMNDKELGMYIKLLCHCWIEDGLPINGTSRVVDLYFKKSPTVARCFVEIDGKYRNPRLDLERERQRMWREKCSKGGLHSAENKKHIKGSVRLVQVKANSSLLSSPSSLLLKKKNKSSSLCPRIFADVDIRLTQLLVDLMQKNNPDSSILKHLTEKRRAEWMNQCRLLREADKRTEIEIEQVIQFSQADSFWKQNILSMPKLREKWDQLWLKAQGPGREGYQGPDAGLPGRDVYREQYEKNKAKEEC